MKEDVVMLKKINNNKYEYMKNLNVNYQQYDILSSYMSMLNQMKITSHTRMSNDIDLYQRNDSINLNIEQE